MSQEHRPIKRTRTRTRGSGEIPVHDIPLVEHQFGIILGSINEVAKIQNGEYKDLDEVHAMRNSVTEVLESVKNLKALYKKEEEEQPGKLVGKGLDVKSIPFSKFDEELMEERLGITCTDIPFANNAEDFGQRLVWALLEENDANQIQEIVSAVDKRDFVNLIRMLNIIGASVTIQSEARGRMIIDQWLLESIDIASSADIPKSYFSILIPELQISSLKDSPARIVHRNFKSKITYITGSTDYARLTMPLENFTEDHERFIRIPNTAKGFATVLVISPDEGFMLYEAKRQAENLNEHLPQVVVQCVAMSTKRAKQGDVKSLPFCLTTGQEWLFGIVDLSEARCWKTKIFQVNETNLLTIKPIMKLILLWASQPNVVLSNVIKKLA